MNLFKVDGNAIHTHRLFGVANHSTGAGHLRQASSCDKMKNAVFSFSIKCILRGVGYFNGPRPKVNYFVVRMD